MNGDERTREKQEMGAGGDEFSPTELEGLDTIG